MDSSDDGADDRALETVEQDLRAWLDRNGYRLELRIAQILMPLAQIVEQGGQYLDASSERLREFDVRASWSILSEERHHHKLSVVVECKNTRAPWVLFTGRDDLTWSAGLPLNGIDPDCEVCVEVGEEVVAEAVRNIEDWGYSLTEKRNPDKGQSPDHAREAVLAAASAASSMVKRADFESGSAGHHYYAQYVPVVVTTSPVFACSLDESGGVDLREVSIARVAVRPYPESEPIPVVVARPAAFSGFIARLASIFHEAPVLGRGGVGAVVSG